MARQGKVEVRLVDLFVLDTVHLKQIDYLNAAVKNSNRPYFSSCFVLLDVRPAWYVHFCSRVAQREKSPGKTQFRVSYLFFAFDIIKNSQEKASIKMQRNIIAPSVLRSLKDNRSKWNKVRPYILVKLYSLHKVYPRLSSLRSAQTSH